ncbi:MAG: nickel pincer cofactor biosynthesis protein LarC [Chloroflexota bacterium]
MSRAIYFDTFSGISGDMTLGALLHAGLPFDYLQTELAKLSLDSAYRLEMRSCQQQGITGVKLDVLLLDPAEHFHRSLTNIEQLIFNSRLSDTVKNRASAIFRRLAGAESKVHGIAPNDVHFHEVGAVDALVDLVGACIGFDYFQIEEFYCGPLPSGSGFVCSAHGLIPIPAPATLELLTEAGATFAPTVTLSGGIEYPARMEMVTPTGAALVATLCRFERPAFKLNYSGYGYGSKELAWPNALRIWIGETSAKSPESSHQNHSHSHSVQEVSHDHNPKAIHPTQEHHHGPSHPTQESDHQIIQQTVSTTPSEVSVLETNLDDMTPEGLGFLMEKLLAVGALDVYFTPIQMKKNRPAIMLSAIVRPEDEAKLAHLILRESSSFGLRVARLPRYIAGREFDEVEISAGKVRVKRKILDGEGVDVVPEYESVAALARQTGRAWREIYDEVRQALSSASKRSQN